MLRLPFIATNEATSHFLPHTRAAERPELALRCSGTPPQAASNFLVISIILFEADDVFGGLCRTAPLVGKDFS